MTGALNATTFELCRLTTSKLKEIEQEHAFRLKSFLKKMSAISPTTGIEPFGRLVAQVMTTEPYASARRVFWVVDNGSSHRGQRAVDRMRQRWPKAHLVQLPVHASWLNQGELLLRAFGERYLRRGEWSSRQALVEHLDCSWREYNHLFAHPFSWSWTRHDMRQWFDRQAK